MSEEAQHKALLLANSLLQLFRLIRLHDTDNVAYSQPIAAIVDNVEAIGGRAGAVRLQAEQGVIYVNQEPLRGGKQTFGLIQGLVQAMTGCGIAELVLTTRAGGPEVRTFLTGLKQAINLEPEEAVRRLQDYLSERSLKETIWVNAEGEATGRAVIRTIEIDPESYFPLAYARTLVLLRGYVTHLRDEELSRYFTQKLHRALQELASLTPKYSERVLALSQVRGTDEPIFVQMAATGLLAMALGHKLKLPKNRLAEVGLAAMLASLGRFRSPRALLERAELDPAEAAELGKHPYRALGTYLDGKKIDGKLLTCATVAFQLDLDLGKTPVRIPPTEMHPYVAITRICDRFTRLTSDFADRPALLPDQALKQLIEAKRGIDPFVLTVFTNMTGLYPTGSVVALTTGEIAVVVHPNPERPKKPLVAIVMDGGGEDVDGEFLDLADPDVSARITSTVDPKQLGITIPEHILE